MRFIASSCHRISRVPAWLAQRYCYRKDALRSLILRLPLETGFSVGTHAPARGARNPNSGPSSRVTRSPARINNIASTCRGWPCRRSFSPRLRSSPTRISSSKVPKRSTGSVGAGTDMLASANLAKPITALEYESPAAPGCPHISRFSRCGARRPRNFHATLA
jgi:hypothetical protein